MRVKPPTRATKGNKGINEAKEAKETPPDNVLDALVRMEEDSIINSETGEEVTSPPPKRGNPTRKMPTRGNRAYSIGLESHD